MRIFKYLIFVLFYGGVFCKNAPNKEMGPLSAGKVSDIHVY